jgi:two-component system response regulator PilR (NtrC family)
MLALREMISRVARSQAPVHIAGESGTGKELVARLIHQSGPRAEGPFVPVNCGAIPAELMESEFFGHKRGSFTGAVSDHRGLLQSAEGGTLFLDEVAELPLHMQVKLLRVIQEKAVRPVGETTEQPIDVRILSATHRDLAALIAQGRFREDLYYRINVIELRVPALRERVGDIAELAQHVVQRLALRSRMATPQLAPEALRVLQGYPFPGNVRELENILERALTLCSGDWITAADLQLRGMALPEVAVPVHGGTPALIAAADATNADLGDQLEVLERSAIVKALEQNRFNKTAAAKQLGMSFRALRYRIKKLGIE